MKTTVNPPPTASTYGTNRTMVSTKGASTASAACRKGPAESLPVKVSASQLEPRAPLHQISLEPAFEPRARSTDKRKRSHEDAGDVSDDSNDEPQSQEEDGTNKPGVPRRHLRLSKKGLGNKVYEQFHVWVSKELVRRR